MTSSDTATPRVNPMKSVFARTLLLITLATTLVCGITVWIQVGTARETAVEGVRALAEEVTDIVTESVAGAIRFSKPEDIASRLDRAKATSHGSLAAAVAINAAGDTLATADRAPADPALVALGRQAVETGTRAASPDGLTMADPAFFGTDPAPVGAVVMRWSTETRFAELRAGIVSALIAAGVTLAVVLGASAALLRMSLARPLSSVGRAMTGVADGDYDTRPPALDRPDEIGAIARALEALRSRLSDARALSRDSDFKSAVIAVAPSAIMTTDAEMKITYVNPAFLDLARKRLASLRAAAPAFDPDTVVGQSMDVFHRNPAHQRKLLDRAAQGPFSSEIQLGDVYLRLDMAAVKDKAGQILGYGVIWTDITDLKRDAALTGAISRQQILLEFDRTRTLKSANPAGRALLGGDAAIGKGFATLLTPEDASSDQVEAILGKGEAWVGRFRTRAQGAAATIEGSVFAIPAAGGGAQGYFVLGHDVTQALAERSAEESRRAAAQKEQAGVVDLLNGGLASLADGDLTFRFEKPFPAEYETIRSNFNTALTKLETAVAAVVENAGSIRGEAAEISRAADDLSKRTEHQAATLEETSAALTEITSSVVSAAEGAKRANEVVTEARTNAEASGGVVQEAVAAMGQIAQSSDQISKIISVIDDIAFQTNLLALNAGVEAARAGDAGRGFAVVASEVRALAQRSSDAAREINDLISTSGSHVKRGVTLVGDAGEALKHIVASVGDIAGHVQAIAASANEQSTALGEITSAVDQLDQVTQQNAAMFEETTAASHSLTSETETLFETTRRFRITATPIAQGAGGARGAGRRSAAPSRPAARPVAGGAGRAQAAKAVAARPEPEEEWQDF